MLDNKLTTFNPLELASTSRTFCILPFIHQYIGPGGDVTPCCVFNSNNKSINKAVPLGSLKDDSLQDIWNNENTKELRLAVLTGKEHEGCYTCTSRLDLDDAYKDGFNKKFMAMNDVKKIVSLTQEDGKLEEHKLFYIDARWNNLCNLKCRTCGPSYSSSWIEDHKKLDNFSKASFIFSGKTEKDLLDQMIKHLGTAKMIYFAGGEPMMQKEHYEVLKKLTEIENFDIDITYNTNLSQLKLKGYDEVYNYWKKFKNVEVAASIDGSYERAEYWRSGTKWKNIVENVQLIKNESPNVKFKIAFTISWVNAYNFTTLHKEWVEKGFIQVNDCNLNPLDFPDYYSLKNIPKWKKDEIEDILFKHIDWLKQFNDSSYIIHRINNVMNFMKSVNDESTVDRKLLTFDRMNGKLDTVRSEDFYQIFPEHQNISDYINGIKKINKNT
jgi:organic radical activating enzyme